MDKILSEVLNIDERITILSKLNNTINSLLSVNLKNNDLYTDNLLVGQMISKYDYVINDNKVSYDMNKRIIRATELTSFTDEELNKFNELEKAKYFVLKVLYNILCEEKLINRFDNLCVCEDDSFTTSIIYDLSSKLCDNNIKYKDDSQERINKKIN